MYELSVQEHKNKVGEDSIPNSNMAISCVTIYVTDVIFLWWAIINVGYERQLKTDDELMAFGAIDFGNFNHALRIQGTIFICLFYGTEM